jgi:hypothetical protein
LHQADDKKSTIIVSARGETSNIRTAMNRGGIRFMRAAVRAKPSASWLAVPLLLAFSPRIASRLRWWKLPPEVSRVAQ